MHAAGTYKRSLELTEQDTELEHSRQWSFNALNLGQYFASFS